MIKRNVHVYLLLKIIQVIIQVFGFYRKCVKGKLPNIVIKRLLIRFEYTDLRI